MYSYTTYDYAFGLLFHRLRKQAGLTQAALATMLEVSERTIQKWESGKSYPTTRHRRHLLTVFVKQRAFTVGKEREEAEAFWTHVQQHTSHPMQPLDQLWFTRLLREQQQQELPDSSSLKESRAVSPSPCYGRQSELATLLHWAIHERSQLLVLTGMGGIGKTRLAETFVQHATASFEQVSWHAYNSAPPLEDGVDACLKALGVTPDYGTESEGAIGLLLKHLQTHRCLLVFDNVETILQAGSSESRYRAGYETYSRFLTLLGTHPHQSCILLTSREKFSDIGLLEAKYRTVHSLQLSGLGEEACRQLLIDEHVKGSDAALQALTTRYAGNPLALRLVAATIREIFGGESAALLITEQRSAFGDIHILLEEQFERMSIEEQEVLYWLALEQEPVSMETFLTMMVPSGHRAELAGTLDALVRRRGWVERRKVEDTFTLHLVLQDYLLHRFVEQVYQEIMTQSVRLLRSHALLHAQASDAVRVSQVRLILKPILEKLHEVESQRSPTMMLDQLVAMLPRTSPPVPGYVGANLFHLLAHAGSDWKQTNFSRLSLWQADFRTVDARELNLTEADLTGAAFLEPLGAVLCVAFSPDGTLLAAGTTTGDLSVWQVQDGRCSRRYTEHTGWVTSIAWSPDGSLLVSGSADETIRVWSLRDTESCAVWRGHTGWITSVAFHPNGLLVASGSNDQTIRLWQEATGTTVQTLQGHHGPVNCVTFSPDGTLLASGSDDCTIRLWETSSRQLYTTLTTHKSRVNCIAFSPDGTLLVSGSDDQSIGIWNTLRKQQERIFVGHTKPIRAIAFSPDSTTIATSSYDQTVRLWDVREGKAMRIFSEHRDRLKSVAWSPDGKLLASSGYDQTIRLWDTEAGTCVRSIQGALNSVLSVAFSPIEATLVTAHEDSTIRLWERHTQHATGLLSGHHNWVTSLAFHPHEHLLASGSEDYTIRLWNLQSQHCIRTLRAHTHSVWAVAWSPNGQLLASGGEDDGIKLWDPFHGNCLGTLCGHSDWITSLAFSPDNRFLASGSADSTISIWEVRTGSCLATLRGHTKRVCSLAWSPDGSHVMSGSGDQTIKIWEWRRHVCRTTFYGHTETVRSVAVSADGRMLASGSYDRTTRLWNLADGRCIQQCHGHQGFVQSVAFSADGDVVCSGSIDGTAKLWDVQTGTCIHTFRIDRPYERMNIAGVYGVTERQKNILQILGATSDKEGAML